MVKGKKVIVLGENIVFSDNNMFFKTRCETRLFRNTDDVFFIQKLTNLGISIIESKRTELKVLLPYQWIHFKRSPTEELICDDKGRVRIILDTKNKTTELRTCVTYTIEVVESENPLYNYVKCKIMFYDKIITDIIYSYKDFERHKKDFAIGTGKLVESTHDIVKKTISNTFPNWEDELSYWNVDYGD